MLVLIFPRPAQVIKNPYLCKSFGANCEELISVWNKLQKYSQNQTKRILKVSCFVACH